MLVVVAGPAHPLATAKASGDRRIPPRTLHEQIWLLCESGSGTREVTDQAPLPKLLSYRRSIELNSSEAIKRAVAEGLGVACLSAWALADFLSAGRLVRLSTSLANVNRQCHLVVHRLKQPTPAMKAFIDRAGSMQPPGRA